MSLPYPRARAYPRPATKSLATKTGTQAKASLCLAVTLVLGGVHHSHAQALPPPDPVNLTLPLPPPAAAQPTPSEAPWITSPAPFILNGQLLEVSSSETITRKQLLGATSGYDVHQGQTLSITGPICGDTSASSDPARCDDPGTPNNLIKLGEGHLALAGANHYRGNTLLMQGSLAVQSGQALGLASNFLDMAEGTRLELVNGIDIAQGIHVQPVAAMTPLLPSHWGLGSLPASGQPATLRVEQGTATLRGELRAQTPVVKDGAGTLRFLGSSAITAHPFQLREGGLQVGEISLDRGHLWLGTIHSLPGTTLSGIGYIQDAAVAGHLQPGDPRHLGTLMFGDHLQLADSSHTRIRIGADGQADQLWSLGTVRLAGSLLIAPTLGNWHPATSRWVIVQAEGGLDYQTVQAGDPAASTPVGQATGDGRFAQVRSTLPYLSPILSYGPQAVTLQFAYNRRGLNHADASWRSALLDDSRFVRESALMHGARGRAWLQSWGANSQRQGSNGLLGDERDTSGLQLGISRPWGRSGHWSVFVGVQDSLQHSRPAQADGSTQPYQLRDRATHLGLGLRQAGTHMAWSAGLAHAWHRARIERHPAAADPALHSRARATLTQAWLDVRPTQPLALGNWGITPWARGAWLHLRRPAVAETQSSLAAVTLPAQTDARWLTQLGVQAQRRWDTTAGEAVAEAALSLRRLWGSRALHSPQAYQADPGQRFDAQGLPATRHALQLDVGVQAPISPRATVILAYTGQTGGGQLQHGAWLGIRLALDGKLSQL
ncbi:autotransporter outer membrane beta-barrel domain-containing protein [Castellaniella caeni]